MNQHIYNSNIYNNYGGENDQRYEFPLINQGIYNYKYII
jgi:hypothetical protein